MKRKIFSFIFVLLLVLSLKCFEAQAAIPADAVVNPANGHSYYVFMEEKTPMEAQEYCESMGGYLATITSQEEQDFVAAIASASGSKGLTIGGTDYGHEGTWVWMNGEEWTYSNWRSGEPNNGLGSGQNYNQMIRSWNWQWDDYYGGYHNYSERTDGFLCEWDYSEVDDSELIISGNFMQNGVVSASYTGTAEAIGGTASYKWTRSGKIPTGLKLKTSGTKATLSGTPTKAGTFNFTLNVTDKYGKTASEDYTIVITQPEILAKINQSGSLNEPFEGTAEVVDGTSSYKWSRTGKIPTGLALKTSGAKATLSGTPTKAGTFKFTLIATDKNGVKVSEDFTIKIIKPSIIGKMPQSGVIKQTFSGTATVTKGTAPYTWTKSGEIPNGLKLKTSGAKATLSGTATKAGTFTFTLTATDTNGATVSAQYTVKITKPIISGVMTSTGVVKKSYSSSVKVSGGTAPYMWKRTKGSLPPGLSLTYTDSKVTLKGKPTKAGTYTFTLKAYDDNEVTASREFTINISEASSTSSTSKSASVNLTRSEKSQSYADTAIEKISTENHSEINTNFYNDVEKFDDENLTGINSMKATLSAELKILSEDILLQGSGKDEDIITVRKNQPLRFTVDNVKISSDDIQVYVDDEIFEEYETEAQKFILPAEFVKDDFKIQVKTSKFETQEIFISVE